MTLFGWKISLSPSFGLLGWFQTETYDDGYAVGLGPWILDVEKAEKEEVVFDQDEEFL